MGFCCVSTLSEASLSSFNELSDRPDLAFGIPTLSFKLTAVLLPAFPLLIFPQCLSQHTD